MECTNLTPWSRSRFIGHGNGTAVQGHPIKAVTRFHAWERYGVEIWRRYGVRAGFTEFSACSLMQVKGGSAESGRFKRWAFRCNTDVRDKNSECCREKCFPLKVRTKWFQEDSV